MTTPAPGDSGVTVDVVEMSSQALRLRAGTTPPAEAGFALKMILAAIVLALLFRAACVGSSRLPLQLVSGLWLGIAAWILGALALAWVPIWQMLVLGLVLAAGTATVRAKVSIDIQPVADFIAIAVMALLSVTPEQTGLVLVAAFVFAAAGFLMDLLTRRMRPQLQWALLAMPVALIAVLAVQIRQPGNFGSRLLREDPFFPLRLVLVAPSPGARLPLENGTAAWLLKTPHSRRLGTAIVMHGNHRNGSEQPSSVALQGALVRAGYDVLSVDHPGFGASHAPHSGADWREWDPSLGPAVALKYLQREHPSAATIVVGHSMGVDVALKFVADGAPVQATYLFAGSLDRPHGPNWLNGFHRERDLPCCLPPQTMHRIRDEFYGGGDRFAAALPAGHAPVHYVRFGIEHADVTVSREPLYTAISPPKRACDFASVSHYFNTLSLRRFALVDTRTVLRTAEIFSAGTQGDAACGRRPSRR